MTVGVRTKFTLLVALASVALGGVSCSGGGGIVGSTGFSCLGDATGVICLERCNLGCSTTGCERTDIAQNEIIILTFSEAVDPNSVNSSSIRFRTPSGDEPVGEFFVNGPRVEFVPTLSISGGQTFFGFTSGETYTMTIVGGNNELNVVRGTSGKPFGQELTCTLQSTNGIVDLNGVPPSATLVVPTASLLSAAPRDTEIQLEFNELIDATPFLTGTQSPVSFDVRRTRPDGNGGFECNPNSQPQTLAGSQTLTFDAARGVSVLNFVPSQQLPSNVCIEISVTDGVTDLSGQPAQPQLFTFSTVVVPLTAMEIVEDFDDNLLLDVDASAGTWAGGLARFAEIGGDGRHGVFSTDLAMGGDLVNGLREYVLDCDNTVIPPSNTTTGAAIPITDGRFFFSTMVIPNDVRLRFVGSVPPVITVAGRLDVQGEIALGGQSVISSQIASASVGQAGAGGGIFGGDGGQGGDRCLGFGPGTGSFDGRDGETVKVLAGHAYLGAVAGTAGRGSVLYPASGLSADQQFNVNPPTGLMYCLSASAGGSGGGLWTAGQQGRVVDVLHGTTSVPNASSFMGLPAPGGAAMQLLPFPATTGSMTSSQHFLVGGAGGGGAASNCTLSLSVARTWASGAGGGGGGGAIALRAGGSLRLGPSGRLLAAGGDAWDYIGTSAAAQVAPGGGGSGGSIVLQSAGSSDLIGTIDVRGGAGGFFRRIGASGTLPIGGIVEIQGGNGSSGFVRFEKPVVPDVSELATMLPAAGADNVGVLAEIDDLISMRSKFYSTNLIFGPEFSHYQIDATVDGVPVSYSDDPAVAALEATTGAAVRVLFQAANLDITTGSVLEVRPWRTSVRSSPNQNGIASDGLNGYRFMLFFDRMFATTLTIDRVTVVYRN